MSTINYGIDLGTSNSAIAFAKDGKAELFHDTNNVPTLPSAVMFEAGRMVVGHKAYQRQWKEGAVAVKFKRALGTNQAYHLAGGTRPFSPEEMSAAVLLELKRLALLRGHTVDCAVICTPAKFTASQCEGTNAAAALAGIQEPVLVSEPMAASFGYGFTQERKGAWIVYDLGAGTFDAVVVRVFEGRMQPQVPEGDNRLGGSDMDRILWDELVAPKIARALDLPPDHPIFSEGCAEGRRKGGLFACEAAKIALSQQPGTEINTIDIRPNFQIDGRDVELVIPITRAELESRIEPLLDRSVAICRKLIEMHRDVSEILLVGGPTVMPMVRAKLKALPVGLNGSIDPMTAVATGAALYASTLPAPRLKTPRPAADAEMRAPAAITLDYEPTSEFEEATVIVRCADPRVGWVEIESRSGDFNSGRIPPSDGGHVLMIPLTQPKSNGFAVKAFTATGGPLACEPAEFSIFHGLTAGAAPLPHSYRIELQNPDSPEHHVDRVLIAQGTPLPARGTIKARTTAELARGCPGRIEIKIWEGDRKNLRANLLAYSLELTGANVPRKLPANTEVEVSLEVNSSRLARAKLYIPIADEEMDIPKRDERIDVNNPKHLEMCRRRLSERIEQLDETADVDGKVALEVCRRKIFNESTTRALKLAKQGGSDAGDACARVEESLRETEDELAAFQEKRQEQWIPAKWRMEVQQTAVALQSPLVQPRDQALYDAMVQEGDRAIAAERWGKANEQIREMALLRFRIYGRSPQFWRKIAHDLPHEPEVYLDPREAQQLLERIPLDEDLNQLSADVARLHSLLPRGLAGGEAMLPTNLR
jgi:molecular chaperone DnaK